MIQKWKFKKTPVNPTYFSHIQAFLIDSVAERGVMYGVDGNRFFVINPYGFAVCDLDETKELAEQMIPKIRKEILDIYEDVKDYKRMEIKYEKPVSSLYASVRHMKNL